MLRYSPVALVALFIFAGGLLAADKELTAKIVKVDVKKKVVTVSTEDGKKDYDVNDDTKFIGPKGGVSAEGIKDDRLVPGAEIRLIVAANNRTVREVHLPERKGKKK